MNSKVHFTLSGTESTASSVDVGWLKLRLDKGAKAPFSEFIELTPGIASLLLSRNPSNRPIKELTVKKYARDILAGRFSVTGESIAVSRCGFMNDGQHRCAAVIRTNKSITTNIVFGVDREARLQTDQGSPRGVGDYLSMDGVQNSNVAAAGARLVMHINAHGKHITGAQDVLTKSEIFDFVRAHEARLMESVKVAGMKGSAKIAGPSVLVACHYFFSSIDEGDAKFFFRSLISGAGLSERDPIFVAREKMIDRSKRLNRNEQLKTLFSAWNHFRAGKTVRSIYHTIKKDEKLPELK